MAALHWTAFFAALPVAVLMGGASADVSCGGHRAGTCSECPQGNGRGWCHGACHWDDRIAKCVEVVSELDLYAILEVADTAETNEIARSYRKISSKYHPDKNPTDTERFAAARDAYEVLSDPKHRILYDTGGMDAVKDGEAGKLTEGAGEEIEMELPLADFYTGAKREVLFKQRRVICRRCRSTGSADRCQGCQACPSKQRQQMFIRNGMMFQQDIEEPSTQDCKFESLALDIVVEPGASVGDRVVFKHMASQMPGQIPGHVVVILKEQTQPAHPPFSDWQRRGPTLRVPLELTLRESLLGFDRRLKHLDGHTVVVSREGVTKPHRIIVIEGEGMPSKDDRSEFGELQLEVSVHFPESFTPSEHDELSAVQALMTGQAQKEEL